MRDRAGGKKALEESLRYRMEKKRTGNQAPAPLHDPLGVPPDTRRFGFRGWVADARAWTARLWLALVVVLFIVVLSVPIGLRAIRTFVQAKWGMGFIGLAILLPFGIFEFQSNYLRQYPKTELQARQEKPTGSPQRAQNLEQVAKSDQDSVDTESIQEWRRAVRDVLKETQQVGVGGEIQESETTPKTEDKPGEHEKGSPVQEVAKAGQQAAAAGKTGEGETTASGEDKARVEERRSTDQPIANTPAVPSQINGENARAGDETRSEGQPALKRTDSIASSPTVTAQIGGGNAPGDNRPVKAEGTGRQSEEIGGRNHRGARHHRWAGHNRISAPWVARAAVSLAVLAILIH